MQSFKSSATFESQLFQNHKEQSFAQVNPHRIRDHSKEFFYPLNDEKENQLLDKLKVTKINTSFQPQYQEVSIEERRLREHYNELTIKQFNQNRVSNSDLKPQKQELSAKEKKYLELRGSLFNQENSPLADQLSQSKSPLKRQNTIDQVKLNNYLQYARQQNHDNDRNHSFHRIQNTQRQSTDFRNNSFLRNEQRSSQQNNEKSVEVIHLELKGIDKSFDEEQFKKICKDQGFHVVFCHSDYNKITNQQTGNGRTMLRRSLEKSTKVNGTNQIKKQLKQQGIQFTDRVQDNRLKDLIPNAYIKQQQILNQINKEYWRQEGGGIVRNKSEFTGTRTSQLHDRYLEFSKNL